MVGVLTVDDQAVFRAAARDVIDATPGFEPVGEAISGPEALEIVSQVRARLALVDVRMPGMDGVETARLLRTVDPALVVVLISLEDAASLPSSASACGAAELVRKQDFCPTLLRELWAAHGKQSGDRSITRDG
jgi:two-component system, NarL family, invasion response regulator UvrY